jgi:ADP-ribosylglycohydrolase
MPTLPERYAGLLYGSLAADALALAPHWIYDQDEIVERFGRVTELLAPALDGYHGGKKRGDQTHYGDQELVLMDSLAGCGGKFVPEDFATRWRDFWAGAKSYRDHATKETLAHLAEGRTFTQAGSASTELGGAGRIAPLLVALRAEKEEAIVAAARAQTALTHNSPEVIDAAEFIARLTFLLLGGAGIVPALEEATKRPYGKLPAGAFLDKAKQVRALPTAQAVSALGASCPLEKALPSIFLLLLQHGDELETALIENVMAGGDSAARGSVLGLFLGAAHGTQAIPARWSDALTAQSRVDKFLQTAGLGDAGA